MTTTNETYKFPGKAYDSRGEHTGPGPWLNLIWAANDVSTGFFGQPDFTGDWWAGGYVEEYADARVIHNPDESVSVVPTSPFGAEVLSAAAQAVNV
jgi:hypothetical protein